MLLQFLILLSFLQLAQFPPDLEDTEHAKLRFCQDNEQLKDRLISIAIEAKNLGIL